MKKFHKRAAVFLTAATLAGLPAGAFFYSSPGSLTVWADNVEVESSEESSPEDVDFSDGSEVEIHADPVEQAQEDAGNDVTETPEVGITFTEPEGWQTDTATVKIQVEDTKNTGAFSIAKVEARLSENGGWSDITGNMEVSISSNCSVYVRVTDQNGNTYEQNRYIECFDKTKPTIIAAAKNGILIVQDFLYDPCSQFVADLRTLVIKIPLKGYLCNVIVKDFRIDCLDHMQQSVVGRFINRSQFVGKVINNFVFWQQFHLFRDFF